MSRDTENRSHLAEFASDVLLVLLAEVEWRGAGVDAVGAADTDQVAQLALAEAGQQAKRENL